MLDPNVTDGPAEGFDSLTARELEVLKLTSGGLTNATVAKRLGLTVHAVKFHLASIFKKLEVHNRTGAAAIFFSAHIAKPQHGSRIKV